MLFGYEIKAPHLSGGLFLCFPDKGVGLGEESACLAVEELLWALPVLDECSLEHPLLEHGRGLLKNDLVLVVA